MSLALVSVSRRLINLSLPIQCLQRKPQGPSLQCKYAFRRWYCNSPNEGPKPSEKAKGLFAKFKKMSKDYWYVLIPVHVVTSTLWLGAFYHVVRYNIDIRVILEWFYIKEEFVEKVTHSSLGYFAGAYALYKLATPIRYLVTLGGTTIAIRWLRARGQLKTSKEMNDKLKAIFFRKKE